MIRIMWDPMGRPPRQNFHRLVRRNAARETHHFLSDDLTAPSPHPLWMRVSESVMAFGMYLAPVSFLFDEVAQAARVVDPRAPIQSRPSVTQTSTHMPAVNITVPAGATVQLVQNLTMTAGGRRFCIARTKISSRSGKYFPIERARAGVRGTNGSVRSKSKPASVRSSRLAVTGLMTVSCKVFEVDWLRGSVPDERPRRTKAVRFQSHSLSWAEKYDPYRNRWWQRDDARCAGADHWGVERHPRR